MTLMANEEIYKRRAKYWEEVAYLKESTTPLDIELFSQFTSKYDRILDYGCGYGRTLHELSEHGYSNLYGIDNSNNMINRGKKAYPALQLIVNKATTIPFAENWFQAVILFGVLTCMPLDEEQLNLMQEISRVLKPRGIIYINDFLINYDARNVARYREIQQEKQYGYGVIRIPNGVLFRHHTKTWIKQLTSSFITESYTEQKFATLNNHEGNGFSYIGRKP